MKNKKNKIIYLDIDDVLSGYNRQNVVKSSLWDTYKERMRENWEGKVFGITLPLFAILQILLLIIFPVGEFSWLALILQGSLSLWFIVSYGLLIRRQIKDEKQELKEKIWRDSKKSF